MGWIVLGVFFAGSFVLLIGWAVVDTLRLRHKESEEKITLSEVLSFVFLAILVSAIVAAFAAAGVLLVEGVLGESPRVRTEAQETLEEVIPICALSSVQNGCVGNNFVFVTLDAKEQYVVMEKQEDGGLKKNWYPADSTVIYQDGNEPCVEIYSVEHTVIWDESKYVFPPFWREPRQVEGDPLPAKDIYKIHIPEGSLIESYAPMP